VSIGERRREKSKGNEIGKFDEMTLSPILIGRERRSFGRSILSDADDSEECEVLRSDGRTNPKAQLPLRIRVPNSAGKKQVPEARASVVTESDPCWRE
jgi:hypothetical protein